MDSDKRKRYVSYFDTYDYWGEMETGKAWKVPSRLAKMNHIRRIVGNPEGKRILDAGCGSGIFSVIFAKAGADVKAIDISEKSIRTVKEWAKKEAVWIDAEVSTTEGFKGNKRFDIILALDSTMYTDNFRPISDNIFHHLKPGGILIFKVPNFFRWASLMSAFDDYPLSKIKSVFRKAAKKKHGLPYMKHPPWVWEALLRKSGFEIESKIGCFIFPSLKSERADMWLWKREWFVSLMRLFEYRVSDRKPFHYMGQSFIVVARRPK